MGYSPKAACLTYLLRIVAVMKKKIAQQTDLYCILKIRLDQVLELGEEQVVIFLTLSIHIRKIIIAAMPHKLECFEITLYSKRPRNNLKLYAKWV